MTYDELVLKVREVFENANASEKLYFFAAVW